MCDLFPVQAMQLACEKHVSCKFYMIPSYTPHWHKCAIWTTLGMVQWRQCCVIERGEYMLELEHRSFSHRLVEGYLVIQEVNIRKNRALKKKPTHCVLVQQLFCGVQTTYLKMENISTTFKTCMIVVPHLWHELLLMKNILIVRKGLLSGSTTA